MEVYVRMLEGAQRALERRNKSRQELEYMLDDRRTEPDDEPTPRKPAMHPEPETWPRLPI
jgi:hypothetical protein